MMRKLYSLVLLVLFAVILTPSALGQNFFTLRGLTVTTVNPVCGRYATIVDHGRGPCAIYGHYPWYAAGDGWLSITTSTNGGNKSAAYNMIYLSMGGAANPVAIFDTLDGQTTPATDAGSSFTLDPGQSQTTTLWYPGNGSGPLPNQLQDGPIAVMITAPDAVTLDAQAAQLVYEKVAQDGSVGMQVAIQLIREVDATPGWVSNFTATPPSQTPGPAANNSCFAVENLGNDAQSVAIALYDQHGNQITVTNTPVLQPNGVFASCMPDFFGEAAMFPYCVCDTANGICAKLVSNNGLVQGTVRYVGTGGEPVAPVTLRAIGSSIASFPTTPLAN